MRKLLFAALALLAFQQTQAQVITEIMYRSPLGGTVDSLEFVEIHNPTAAPIDLTNYRLRYNTTSNMITFGAVTLAAGDYIVVGRDTGYLRRNLGVASNKMFPTGTQLNNSGTITLRNAAGAVVDSVIYNASFPNASNGNGASAIICNPMTTNNLEPTNWLPETASTGLVANNILVKATPAAANSCSSTPYVASSFAALAVNDANGVPTQLYQNFAVRGVVNSGNFRASAAGYEFTLSDFQNNGITVFRSTNLAGFTLNPGDSLLVHGMLSQFNGLTQILADTIIVQSTGNAQLTPMVITAPFNESQENKIVRLNGIVINPSQWTTGAGAGGFTARGFTGTDSFDIRIDNDVAWYNLPCPTGVVDIIGTMSQFDNTSPFDAGYQLKPRYLSDIITGTAPQITFNPATATVSEGVGSYTVNLSILNPNLNPTSVEVRIGSSSTATAPDYSFTNPGVLTFPGSSSTNLTFSVTITDDTDIEGPETLVFELFNPTNGASFIDSVFTLYINDNDAAPLVLSEIMYNDPSGPDSLEFIEIYNPTAVQTNLQGYRFSQGVTFTFPASASVAANSYVVVAKDSAAIRRNFNVPTSVNIYQWVSGQALTNTGEPVTLQDANNNTVSSFDYTPLVSITAANGGGSSLILCDLTTNASIPANWGASTTNAGFNIGTTAVKATPGAANGSCAGPMSYPVRTIAQIRSVNATTGVADSLGVACEIRAVVHSDDFRGTAGVEFAFIDHTNTGLIVFKNADLAGYTVTRGDSLHLRGTVAQFNGVVQFIPDTAILISQGNALVTPLTVTNVSEATEGKLIRFASIVRRDTISNTAAGRTIRFLSGTDTVQVRVDGDVDLYNTTISCDTLEVVGIGTQFDNSNPFTSTYQILPRDARDVTVLCLSTGVSFLPSSSLQIFPNPASQVLFVQAEGQIQSLRVSNTLGQVVMQSQELSANQTELNISNLPTGLYHLQVQTQAGWVIKSFIVRQ